MTTAHLLIVCATALALAALATWAMLERASRRAQLQREIAMHERAIATLGRDAAAHTRAAQQPVADLAAAMATLQQAVAAIERIAGPGPGPSLVGATVVAHTRKPDDQSVRGVVRAHHADRLELRDSSYVHASGDQPAAGIVAVELPVSSLQILEPAHGVEAA